MNPVFKPENYNSVSPYFIVKDAKAFIHFLQELFGGEEMRRYTNADGSIMHAEVKIDDSIIMTGEASDDFSPTSFWIHVYVPDAVSAFTKAISLDCEKVEAPIQKEGDPDIRGTFRDPWGNFWAVGTQLK